MARTCPKCGRDVGDGQTNCPDDQSLLVDANTGEYPWVGSVLGGAYRIDRLVHEGGMAFIYRATHLRMGKPAACKVLKSSLQGPARERFELEAKLCAAVTHPSVVQVFDYGLLPGGLPYLLMEWLDGEDVAHRLRREPDNRLPIAQAVSIVAHVCDAVAALHAQDVLHRDLKPSNIFLQQTGDAEVVRLIDLGIARRVAGYVAPLLTAEHATVGTPEYMSPEQVQGSLSIEFRSDVFSLGSVLYELLTGALPFAGDTPREIMLKILHGQPEAPSLRRSGIHPDLEAVIARAHAKEAERRFATVAEMGQALRSVPVETTSIAIAGTPVAAEPFRFVTVLLADLRAPAGRRASAAEIFSEAVEGAGGSPSSLMGGLAVGVFGGARPLGDEPLRAVRASLEVESRLHGNAVRPILAVATVRKKRPLGASEQSDHSKMLRCVAALTQATERSGTHVDLITRERILRSFDLGPPDVGSDQFSRVNGERAASYVAGERRVFGRSIGLAGRRAEVDLVLETFERARDECMPWMVTALGDVGVGKSHFLNVVETDARASAPATTWLKARADPSASGVDFNVVAQAVRSLIGAEVADGAARVALARFAAGRLAPELEQGLGRLLRHASDDPPTGTLAAEAAPPTLGEVTAVMDALVTELGSRGPVALIVDDVQWTDQASLSVLEALHDGGRAPLAMLMVARPDLSERHPGFMATRERHLRLELRPLSDRAMRSVVHELVGECPADLEAWLLRRAHGNILFLEAVLWTLVDRGVLVRDGAAWRLAAAPDDAVLPPLVEGIMQARIEALLADEREVVLRASVFGDRFWVAGLHSLGVTATADVLDRLVHRGVLATVSQSTFAGTTELRFQLPLLRETASRMLPGHVREQMTSVAAEWLARQPVS